MTMYSAIKKAGKFLTPTKLVIPMRGKSLIVNIHQI